MGFVTFCHLDYIKQAGAWQERERVYGSLLSRIGMFVQIYNLPVHSWVLELCEGICGDKIAHSNQIYYCFLGSFVPAFLLAPTVTLLSSIK